MPTMMARRLFVGLPVSLRTVDVLAGAAETLARRAQQARLAVRWVAPARYHVTVKYLGWCRPEAIDPILDGLRRAAARAEPLRFQTSRLGAFPSAGRATVVWAGVEEGKQLGALVTAIEEEMVALGFARETRRFHPHVTMGRLREPADVADVLLPMAEQVFSETRAGDLIIYESPSRSDSSEYPVIASLALGAPILVPKRQTSRLERDDGEQGNHDG